jgi:hypothetical protein
MSQSGVITAKTNIVGGYNDNVCVICENYGMKITNIITITQIKSTCLNKLV